MPSLIGGALGMLMLEKVSGRKCPNCGAGGSLKIDSINTDDFERYSKETEMIMRCKECGGIVRDQLGHPKNYAADVTQMYAIRYVKEVENFAEKFSRK